jgi:arsenite-transporting ATPase
MYVCDLLIPKAKNGTKCVFFGGKGGVGKTSCAASAAVWLAERGYKTLIVSTDPAGNKLSDVFEETIGTEVKLLGINSLYGIEIDARKAAEEYRERILEPLRMVQSEAFIKTLEEQLSSPCAEEMAAFDKFIDYVEAREYDVIIFDTAPTSLTLRLLELPSAWSNYIGKTSAAKGLTCIGPAEALASYKERYDKAMQTLTDPEKTAFIMVLTAEATPISEAERATKELNELGIKVAGLIVNMVIPKKACEGVPFFLKRYEMQQRYLNHIYRRFNGISVAEAPLLDTEVKGLKTLSQFAEILYEQSKHVI